MVNIENFKKIILKRVLIDGLRVVCPVGNLDQPVPVGEARTVPSADAEDGAALCRPGHPLLHQQQPRHSHPAPDGSSNIPGNCVLKLSV